MKQKKQQQKNNNKSVIIYILMFVIVVGLVFGAFVLLGKKEAKFAQGGDTPESEQVIEPEEDPNKDGVVMGGEDGKIVMPGSDVPEAVTPDDTGKARVNLYITSAWQDGANLKASGIVQNSVDDSGRCVFYFMRADGTGQAVESEATRTPTTVSCATASVDTRGIKGEWTVQLSYESDNVYGVSDDWSIEVR